MIHFIIDGNNLIGKIKSLSRLQYKDKKQSRKRLAYIIDRYFNTKKAKVSLHFDGFEDEPIKISNAKILYSDKSTADDKIKNQISGIVNRKNITLISSDNNLREFAKVCGCTIISSEEFSRSLTANKDSDEEQGRIKSIDEDEIKNLFGVD